MESVQIPKSSKTPEDQTFKIAVFGLNYKYEMFCLQEKDYQIFGLEKKQFFYSSFLQLFLM